MQQNIGIGETSLPNVCKVAGFEGQVSGTWSKTSKADFS